MDLLSTIFVFLAGFFFGYQLLAFKMYRQLLKMAESENLSVYTTEVASAIKLLKLETHNNVFYIYDMKSNDFIVQGNSLEEIATNLKKYKGIETALITAPNKKIITIKNGQVHNES